MEYRNRWQTNFSKNDIKFEIKYFKQCYNSNLLLQELTNEETRNIKLEMDKLNKIIISDDLLKWNLINGYK